jgi:hypothetical protein
MRPEYLMWGHPLARPGASAASEDARQRGRYARGFVPKEVLDEGGDGHLTGQ